MGTLGSETKHDVEQSIARDTQLAWGQEVSLGQWKESRLAADTAKAGSALERPGKRGQRGQRED